MFYLTGREYASLAFIVDFARRESLHQEIKQEEIESIAVAPTPRGYRFEIMTRYGWGYTTWMASTAY